MSEHVYSKQELHAISLASAGIFKPWPHDTPEWVPHLEELRRTRESGESLTRDEFDDLLLEQLMLMECVSREWLMMVDELCNLASDEQLELVGEILRISRRRNCYPSFEVLNLPEVKLLLDDRCREIHFSEESHKFWYKAL